jgi:hypothetical protein
VGGLGILAAQTCELIQLNATDRDHRLPSGRRFPNITVCQFCMVASRLIAVFILSFFEAPPLMCTTFQALHYCEMPVFVTLLVLSVLSHHRVINTNYT